MIWIVHELKLLEFGEYWEYSAAPRDLTEMVAVKEKSKIDLHYSHLQIAFQLKLNPDWSSMLQTQMAQILVQRWQNVTEIAKG